MSNIQQWSFKQPTEEGYYMINSGDVVTDLNMEPVKIFKKDNILFLTDFKGDTFPLSNTHSSYKFLNITLVSKDLDS
jgi:hypothetical protein